jgi:predicted AAA+ superfamily ATPase
MSLILERTIKSYIKNILNGQKQVGKSILLKDLAMGSNLYNIYKCIWEGSFADFEPVCERRDVRDFYRYLGIGYPSDIFGGKFINPVLNLNPKKIIADREVFFKSHILSDIEKNAIDFCNMEKSMKELFHKFICVVAARPARLLKYDSLVNDVGGGINLNRIKTWMGTLEQLGVVYLLPNIIIEKGGEIVEGERVKVYFLDTRLCSYLICHDSPESLMNGHMNGQILETYVLMKILNNYWHNREKAFIYFYRDPDKNEIDFVIEKDGKLYPIEVKKTAKPDVRSSKSFKLISRFCQEWLGAVICSNPEKMFLLNYKNNKVVSIPVWEI